MKALRFALIALYLAVPFVGGPGAVSRAVDSISARGNHVVETRLASTTGLGLVAWLQWRVETGPPPLDPNRRHPHSPAQSSRSSHPIRATLSSPYTAQSVPCELIPLAKRLPYDATAPPLPL
jgi:hypothetical protein